jgi:excisionase family DNA binding protein
MEGFLSLRETAEVLGYSTDWTRRLIKSGKLRTEKLGKQYVISKTELERFLKERALNDRRTVKKSI